MERAQKEIMGRQSYRKDPLAEFERLYKMWVRTKKKIKLQTFPHEKEIEFQAYKKKIMANFKRELATQDLADSKERARSVFSKYTSNSISPPLKNEKKNQGSIASTSEADILKIKLSQHLINGSSQDS